jgi:hypothetical protein
LRRLGAWRRIGAACASATATEVEDLQARGLGEQAVVAELLAIEIEM